MEVRRKSINGENKEADTIPMGLDFFALKYFANLVAVVDEEQIWMADQPAHLGYFPVLLVHG